MEKETIKLMTIAALFSPSNFNLQVQNYNFYYQIFIYK